MLLATYQPLPQNRGAISEEKRKYFEDLLGFQPYWCMPVTSVADFFCHSIFAAPNCGEVLYFIETDDYIRVNKVKHYQRISANNTYTLDGCIDPYANNRNSEFLVHGLNNCVAQFPICGLEYMTHPDIKADFTVQGATRGLGDTINAAIAKELKKYLDMQVCAPEVAGFSSYAEWAASMGMTEQEFQYRMYLEKNKMAFETIVLPFAVKQLLGKEPTIHDIHAIKEKFNAQRNLYMDFSRWTQGECLETEYNQFYTAMHALVEEDSLMCAMIAGIKPGRNEMCLCGSGKKWKKCHGRNA